MENSKSPDLYLGEYIQSLLNKQQEGKELNENELKVLYSREEGVAALREKEERGEPITIFEEEILSGIPVDIAWLIQERKEGRVWRDSPEELILDKYFQTQRNDLGRQMQNLLYPSPN